jgi:opacity protein-like surface antigen
MKRQLVVLSLMLGATCAASAQEAVPDSQPARQNVAAVFSAASAASENLFQPDAGIVLSPATGIASAPAIATPLANAAPDPAPSPAPNPKFIYGGRDDFRWQLGIGVDWLRFRNSIFNASAVGVKSSVTYFTNEWFGIEGNFSATFAPQIFDREHVKVLMYGAGPKIAWREKKWEPWAHAIIGGSHEQPQVAGNSKSSFATQVGGGADYRFNPRLSGRLEANWVHTNYFGQSQNNFELMAGIVFHF